LTVVKHVIALAELRVSQHLGGAATGRAGGAVAGGIIGAAAGAMLGSQLEPRPGGYYWYDGRCWMRYGDGSYHRMPRRYCY
jgi:hypothetical protein